MQNIIAILSVLWRNKIIRFSLIVFFAALAAVFLYQYLTIGQLVIKTSENNNISISTLENPDEALKEGLGETSLSLRTGSYLVNIHDKMSSIKKVVTVKAHTESIYNFDITLPTSIEPVLPSGAFYSAIGNDHINYLDVSTNQLHRLSASGEDSLVDPSRNFQTIKWVDSQRGVAQELNSKKLYSVVNGIVEELGVPFNYKRDTTISYAVAGNGDIYISNGNDVYRGKLDSSFKKIYVSDSPQLGLVAGSRYLLIQKFSNQEESTDPIIPTSIVKRDGTEITKKDLKYFEAVWSPDGTRLAVTGYGTNEIYGPALNKISTLPHTNVTGLTWLDNQTLVYGVSDGVWRYNVSSGSSEIIANKPLGGNVSTLFLNQEKDYLYVTSTKNAASSEFDFGRIGLTNLTKSVPDYIAGLDFFFPNYSSQCGFSYVNFKKPTIVILSVEGQQAGCLTEAKTKLRQDQLPVGSFEFIFAPFTNE